MFLSLNLTPGQALILSHLILNLVSLLPVLPLLCPPCHLADDSETRIWSVSCFLLLSFPLAQRRGLTLGVWLSVPFSYLAVICPTVTGHRDLVHPLANSGTYCNVFTWHVPLLACFKTHVTTSVKHFWPYFPLLLRGLNLVLCTSLSSQPLV